jgi:putative membrane-bound dehydrogenase-like protein
MLLAVPLVGIWLLCGEQSPVGRAADPFPAPFDSERDTAARPLPAAEAAATMRVPDGFRVSVFAAEPDVLNPIAMAWDPRGRLWVAENHTYAEAPVRLERRLRDRVLVFTDTDGDGRADERRVFLDDLRQLTSVEVGHGGVWLLCPPQLLFVPDADGDDVPDGPARVVLDGFDVTDVHHNFANGLRFGPDGWLYGRAGGACPGRVGPPGTPDADRVRIDGGIWRYAVHGGRFEVVCHGTTNPWGHDWNAFGDGFFINTVTGHLWQMIPGARYPRHGTLDPNPHVFEPIEMHADHWHFDTKGGWQKSRDGAADDLGGGHAHSGLMIYLGDNWPEEYRGRLFTWNFHGRRANQEILVREGSGYVARHGADLLASRDPFFRGIELGYGPDGSVLALDWSDTGECHETTGVHRTSGRIFHVAHVAHAAPGRPAARPAADLRGLSCVELAKLMTHANEWFPRQARLLLAERSRQAGAEQTPAAAADLPQAREALGRIVRTSAPPIACRALLTLHASGGCDPGLLRELLDHEDEHLRAWAVRLVTDDWPLDGMLAPARSTPAEAARIAAAAPQVAADLRRVAANDTSGLVRLAVAATLQRLPLEHRPDVAAALLARPEDAADHNLPLLVWYGLMPTVDRDPARAADLALAARWPKTQRLIARRLAGLIDSQPAGVNRLVAAVAALPGADVERNLIEGIAAGLAGLRRAPKPAAWDAVVTRLGGGESPVAAVVRELSAVFGDGRALDDLRRLVLDEQADAGLRRSALEALVRQKDDVREICLRLAGDRRFAAIAAEGLAGSDDAEAARAIVATFDRDRGAGRPRIVAILASRPSFAMALLDAVAAGKIPRSAITAYELRQMRALGDAAVNARLEREWGAVRETAADKRRRIDGLKEQLTPQVLAGADLPRGRLLYDRNCGRCHRLFGAGEAIGPDLTGGNRTNIDYLLENIIDPSGTVARDYRMSVVELADGRVLSGLVTAKDDRTLTLVTPTETRTIPKADVEELTVTGQSPMPEGMLDSLSADEIRDLIGYLMQPAQVPLP